MAGKIFILGLPRTGTSSVCAAFLDRNYPVAHTAFTQAAIEAAQVLADAPVFVDFPELDGLFPDSKFIYLQREPQAWSASARALLKRITAELESGSGVINPILQRSYERVFGDLSQVGGLSDEALVTCYKRHEAWVQAYFSQRPEDLLCLDISHADAFQRMGDFLQLDLCGDFPKLNQNGEITAWKKLKHTAKVDSHLSGPNRRRYYEF